ncbi:MAG TPA: hypothetical protein VNV16_11590 [Methylibium sp.]|nr:hypothetical protein [Methylibium sp.]
MPIIEYPESLPPPSGFPFARREGRALPQGAGNEAPRERMRDAIVDADSVRWRYGPAEMATWRAWFEDTLLNGQRWFVATLPGRGGWLPRVARYIGEQLQITHLGAGFWEVSCRLEVRGLSAAPQFGSNGTVVLLVNAEESIEDESAFGWPAAIYGIERYSGAGAVGNYALRGQAGYEAQPLTYVEFASSVALTEQDAICCEGYAYLPALPLGGSYVLQSCVGPSEPEVFVVEWQQQSPPGFSWRCTFMGQDIVSAIVDLPSAHHPEATIFHWAASYDPADQFVRLFVAGQVVVEAAYTGGSFATEIEAIRLLTSNLGVITPGSVAGDSWRVTVGDPRYTATFVPPTGALTDDGV